MRGDEEIGAVGRAPSLTAGCVKVTNMRKAGLVRIGRWQETPEFSSRENAQPGVVGGKGRLLSMIESREQRFAGIAAMARRDIERRMLACADSAVEWPQMRMLMQVPSGIYSAGRVGRWQESFQNVQEQLREQRSYLQQLRDSQQEQKNLQQQLLKLITYGMIGGGVGASAGGDRVGETNVNGNLDIRKVTTSTEGNTCKEVISWLQDGVNRNSTKKVSKPYRREKSATSEGHILEAVNAKPPETRAFHTTAPVKSTPAFNSSAYVILPVKRTDTPNGFPPHTQVASALSDRGGNDASVPSHRMTQRVMDDEIEAGNESAEVESERPVKGQPTDSTSRSSEQVQPTWVDPLLTYAAEVHDLEDKLRRRWLNPAMDEAIHGGGDHARSNDGGTCTPLKADGTLNFNSPSAPGAKRNFPVHMKPGGLRNLQKGVVTQVDEQRKANSWLTEMILEAVLDDVAKELGSICDEFIDHICSCEFLGDNSDQESSSSKQCPELVSLPSDVNI